MSFLVTYPSAGHHLKDAGASYNGRFENKETISFRDLLVEELKFLKVSYIIDKDTETNSQYQSRIKPGDGSVVLDIHFNAGSPTATGTECYIATNADDLSKKMAEEICEVTSKLLGIKNRGVKRESDSQHSKLGILHTKAGISALWEVCFISNKDDMQRYDSCKLDLAKAIARICKKYDDLK